MLGGARAGHEEDKEQRCGSHGGWLLRLRRRLLRLRRGRSERAEAEVLLAVAIREVDSMYHPIREVKEED